VRSVTADDSSAWLTATTAVAPLARTVPEAITALSTVVDDSALTLSWTAPAITGGYPIDYYTVEYTTDDSTWLADDTVTATTTTIDGLVNGTAYKVRVSAVNALGPGPSATSAYATPRTPSAPSAPQGFTLTPEDGGIALSWSTPADDGGRAIDGYYLEYSADGTSWSSIGGSYFGYAITILGLSNGTTYTGKNVVLATGSYARTLPGLEIGGRIMTSDQALTLDYVPAKVIVLGGGVIGDLTGFAAATYQRGVNFIQIPTTLLAQVDSSVGGKTGVNHPLGKNMIGAFYQPQCVLADTETLNTLDPRQLAAGVAEVIKYGLIRDPVFLVWIEQHIDAINARDPAALSEAIERSCQNKAEVVAADEHEANQRALLNLGHTFGHAIESGMGYGVWLHGEAVAAGMVMAADLSQRMGWIGDTDVARARDLIARGKLPVIGPKDLDKDRYLELMAVDKKVEAGQIRLVLLHALGEAVLTADYDPVLLQQTLDAYRGTRNEPV